MSDFCTRTRLLLGEAAVERLAAAHVLVVGLGGVGGAAAEFLARAGVGRLTLVDGDVVEASNRNRQLPALVSTEGLPKAAVIAARLRDINPAIELVEIPRFLEGEAIGELLTGGSFDFVVDAIDSLGPKTELIAGCVARRLPLVSSMGSGGRRDPARIRLADLADTHCCALARAVRQQLRRRGIASGVRVVFSPEPVPPQAVARGEHRSTVGTISYLPAAFGGFCAQAVIDSLLNPDEDD